MNGKLNDLKNQNSIPLTRLTALWALSESALGGVLHAAHIPFRGMLLSSAAVIIISLIAFYSNKRGSILKATLIVLFIKGAISPHTPITAYFAVFMQGLFGEIIFDSNRFHKFSSIMLGIVVAILTGLQRFITLTLIFGVSLWEAFNQFINYAVNEFLSTTQDPISINFIAILVSLYVLIHLIFGLAAGLFASNFPSKLNSKDFREILISKSVLDEMNHSSSLVVELKKKRWWRKPVYITIFIFLGILLIVTYVNPQAINLDQKSIFLMLIRSFIILSIWFLFISPILIRLIRRILERKHTKYTNEINRIFFHIPVYKQIVKLVWKSSADYSGLKRISFLITGLLVNVLTLELPD